VVGHFPPRLGAHVPAQGISEALDRKLLGSSRVFDPNPLDVVGIRDGRIEQLAQWGRCWWASLARRGGERLLTLATFQVCPAKIATGCRIRTFRHSTR